MGWKPDPSFAIDTPRLIISHFISENDAHCQALIDTFSSPSFIAALGSSYDPSWAIDTVEKARAMINGRFKAIHSKDGYGHYIVCEKSGVSVGLVSLIKSRPECHTSTHLPFPDIGYAFMEHASGKGYATEASRALMDYARAHWGVKEIVGITMAHNMRSQRVLEKLGLESKGLMRLRMYPDRESLVYAPPEVVDFRECGVGQEQIDFGGAVDSSQETI